MAQAIHGLGHAVVAGVHINAQLFRNVIAAAPVQILLGHQHVGAPGLVQSVYRPGWL